ncbi:MAG: 3-methyl-2-oxobutanoate dehydrogenase subunit VorB [Firmicutes bacterium]|nr:3-methyl-2-oxobutanoate dehydrogenase subunit VorB [Bacillota bacterium]
MAKKLMKGNEALAEACLRAGCRFFSGYPITPQTEILEYLCWRMDEVGGKCVQTESELAGVNMLFGAAAAGARALTTTSGPGFSLKQEGISYLCASDVPAVIVDVMRIGCGLGDIFMGQGDYWQLTRGGGHGDYRTIVLAPCSVQESVDIAYGAFDLAEKYRHPVIIATDATIGQMMEPVELPEMIEHDINKYDWAIKPRLEGEEQRAIWNRYWDWDWKDPSVGGHMYPEYVLKKYGEMEETEQRWESVQTEDAEIIIVAYGTSARVAKGAVARARAEGIKLGLIRPITLWPFPKKAFEELGDQVKAFLDVERNILGQMKDDVILADGNKHPVEFYGDYWDNSNEITIVEKVKEMLARY